MKQFEVICKTCRASFVVYAGYNLFNHKCKSARTELIPTSGPAQCKDGHWIGSKEHPVDASPAT